MARPRERTWLFGHVPYEETPRVCGWCGKIVEWASEPQLNEEYSDSPAAIAKFDEYRGEHRDVLVPAPFREGGFAQPDLHTTGVQWVRGSMCDDCIARQNREHAALIAERDKLSALLKPVQPEQAEANKEDS